MKVSELIEKLSKFPQDKEVAFFCDYPEEDMKLVQICEGTREIFIDLSLPSLKEEQKEKCLQRSRAFLGSAGLV